LDDNTQVAVRPKPAEDNHKEISDAGSNHKKKGGLHGTCSCVWNRVGELAVWIQVVSPGGMRRGARVVNGAEKEPEW
jgi:hypothetical protein